MILWTCLNLKLLGGSPKIQWDDDPIWRVEGLKAPTNIFYGAVQCCSVENLICWFQSIPDPSWSEFEDTWEDQHFSFIQRNWSHISVGKMCTDCSFAAVWLIYNIHNLQFPPKFGSSQALIGADPVQRQSACCGANAGRCWHKLDVDDISCWCWHGLWLCAW